MEKYFHPLRIVSELDECYILILSDVAELINYLQMSSGKSLEEDAEIETYWTLFEALWQETDVLPVLCHKCNRRS